MITVVSAVAPILMEDLGRRRVGRLGVPSAGAFDRASAKLAQRLVGNPEYETGLEVVAGARLHSDRAVTAVVTGADAQLSVDGRALAVNEVFSWPAGGELVIGAALRGLRTYVAVHGGFAAHRVLGSASTDVLSGLGPSPLRSGDRIALAHRPAREPLVGHVPAMSDGSDLLRVVLGPRHDWFTPEAVQTLLGSTYTVTAASNRVGLWLSGAHLSRRLHDELPPEPLQRGALQVPASGSPILMGPDHPTTGGYPVIACLVEADWDRCGQLATGDEIRFKAVEPDSPVRSGLW